MLMLLVFGAALWFADGTIALTVDNRSVAPRETAQVDAASLLSWYPD